MNRQKAISILIVLALCASAVAALVLWPKHYMVGQSMSQTIVFWNDQDAFVFLDGRTTGRSRNALQDAVGRSRYGYLGVFLGGFADFSKPDVVAYHLAASGQLDRFALPENTVVYGSWSLADGRLQLTPMVAIGIGGGSHVGTRWDGEAFVPVPAASPSQPQPQAAGNSNLSADDLADDDEGAGSGLLSKAQRQQFKDAGWHYKFLTGYEGGGAEATLPITMGANTFNLTVQSVPFSKEGAARFDLLSFGTKAIQISGEKLASGPQTLWSKMGWQEVSKSDYLRLQQQFGHSRRRQSPVQFTWLFVLLALIVWKFSSWFNLIFTFATMKGRVVKSMATQYSFPPATPGQFPALDLDALERYTREFEGMGFTRLLDFSLVSDSATTPPNFCRLMANSRNHCFGEISQIFPKGKASLPLKGSIQSCLQNGWTLAFSDRKPQAASSLLRRRKALGICMPEASTSELLQSFLKMREQICLDLGIQTVNDDTLQAYMNKVQRSATEMREAVQEKNFVKGLPEYYLRKVSLLQTKPEYVWLGDYPKEAEQRKQGFNTFAAGAR
ncbi:MAG: hypothetical protein WBQ08_23860 [Candidatus Sulfotelmatobacter sp.]